MGRYFIFAAVFIVALFALGCQSSSRKGSTAYELKINVCEEPPTLDPRKARDLKSQMIIRMLFEGLMRMGPLEKIEFALAEKVAVSSDLKTYTFHLRDSVWSNGDPVTAFDFVYAWKNILSPQFPSPLAYHLYILKHGKDAKEGRISLDEVGVRAIDLKTLVVELENSAPYFLELLACSAFFPVHQKMDENTPSWAQSASTYVSNGPFRLAEWKHQDHLGVEKNKTYWDVQNVNIRSMELQMLSEETAWKLFEKGELDWAGTPPPGLPSSVLQGLQMNQRLMAREILRTYFLRTNTERAPFNSPLIRKAFAIAIDRQALVDHLMQGHQTPATGFVPLSLKLQKTPYFRDADVSGARELFLEGLKALHVSKEELPEVCLTYVSSEMNHLIAQAIQNQWFEAFGVRVLLEAIERKVYFDRVSRQDYHMAASDWVADVADPINFLEIFKYKEGGSNNTLWEHPRYTALLDCSVEVADREKRLEILAQSEQILMEEMPIIPIFYSNVLYLTQSRLKDVVLSSMGQIDFKWASIAKEEVK
jgi:oligopeptide transport system substrate-binding protein